MSTKVYIVMRQHVSNSCWKEPAAVFDDEAIAIEGAKEFNRGQYVYQYYVVIAPLYRTVQEAQP